VRYFTAHITERSSDPGSAQRQKFYIAAVEASSKMLSVYYGNFKEKIVSMPLASNPKTKVDVLKSEEKGSDVNIATQLLLDAFDDKFDLGGSII